LQERIWDVTSNGFAFDVGGMIYPGIFGSLRGAFAITNFGPDMCFHGGQLLQKVPPSQWPTGYATEEDVEFSASSYYLPLSFKMGLAYDPIATAQQRLVIGLVMAHPNDGSEKLSIGGEYGWNRLLFVRAGYEYDPDIWEDMKTGKEETTINRLRYGSKLSFGGGIKYTIGSQILSINYASQDMRRFGLRNRISLGIDF
jgi:hypothetical protein